MSVNFRQHSVTLDDDNSARVRQLAKEQELTMSKLIRTLIEAAWKESREIRPKNI